MATTTSSSGVFRLGEETKRERRNYITQPGARLGELDLELFLRPISWRELLTSKPFRSEAWWRSAVIDADEGGRGLIAWDKATKRWSLSESGRTEIGLEPKEKP